MEISQSICYSHQSSYVRILSSGSRSMVIWNLRPILDKPLSQDLSRSRTQPPAKWVGCSGSDAFVTAVHTSLYKHIFGEGHGVCWSRTKLGFSLRLCHRASASHQPTEEFWAICSKRRLRRVSLSSPTPWIATRLRVCAHFSTHG